MSLPAFSRRDMLLLFGAAGALATARAAETPAALPGDSIYQFRPQLVDQDGRTFDLASMRGRPVLASMFYSACDMVCPLIFETIAHTLKSLKPPARDRIHVAMVTFDPAHDTVPVLKDTALRHGCDAHWSLLRGSDADVRRFAALLGAQYRRLPSGAYNHSAAIGLLDAQGRIVRRTGTLGEDDPAFVAAVQAVS